MKGSSAIERRRLLKESSVRKKNNIQSRSAREKKIIKNKLCMREGEY